MPGIKNKKSEILYSLFLFLSSIIKTWQACQELNREALTFQFRASLFKKLLLKPGRRARFWDALFYKSPQMVSTSC